MHTRLYPVIKYGYSSVHIRNDSEDSTNKQPVRDNTDLMQSGTCFHHQWSTRVTLQKNNFKFKFKKYNQTHALNKHP